MNGQQPRGTSGGGRVVCRMFAAGQMCSYGNSCRFSHEVAASVSWGSGGGGRGRGDGGGRGRGDGGGRGGGGRHHHHHHHHHHHAPAYRSRVWQPPHHQPHLPHFRLMSYNVLADTLAHAHARELYPRADRAHLSWQHRWRLVAEEVAWIKPDVLCLQEVDAARWPEVLRALVEMGYEGAHARRTGDRADGCAVLWRRDAFEAVTLPGWGEDEDEDDEDGSHAAPPPHHVLRFAERGLRDNVAVTALLRPRRQRQGGRRQQHDAKRARSAEKDDEGAPDFLLLVSTTHLIFNPKRGDTKLGQMRTLLCELHAQAQGATEAAATSAAPPPVVFPVVCGDLNAAPNSAIYSFATRGQLDCLSCDRRSLSGVVECSGPASPFRVWAAAQRRHYLKREAFSAAAAAAAAAAAGFGAQQQQQQQHRPAAPPPPLDAEALLLSGPLPWLRPIQQRLFEAEVAPPEERNNGVPLALLERFGWDAEGMAQATGEGRLLRVGDARGGGEAGAVALALALAAEDEDEDEEDGDEDDDEAVTMEDEDEDDDQEDEDEDDDDEEEEAALPAPRLPSRAAAASAPPLLLPSACVASHPWPGGLASAYAQVTGREPPATSVHAKFAGTLDYVLYHQSGVSAGEDGWAPSRGRRASRPPPQLRPARVLMPPPLRLLLPPRAPPSAGVPSDHVSVVVDFEVV